MNGWLKQNLWHVLSTAGLIFLMEGQYQERATGAAQSLLEHSARLTRLEELASQERARLDGVYLRRDLSDEQLQQITSEFFGKGDANYATLGVSAEATDEELKTAYRKLAAEHHPDRASDGGAKFRQIKEAWEALRKLRGL